MKLFMKNHSHTFLFLLLVVIAAGALAVFVREWNVRMMKPFIPNQETTYTPPAPAMIVVYAPTSTPAVQSPSTVTSTPDARQTEYVSADGVTHVTLSTVKLMNPFTFSGTTTAFENQANWKLTQKGGKVLGQGYFYVHSPDVGIPGPFSVTGFYDALPTNASGTLMIYEASAKDGAPIHGVSIPVQLDMTTSTVKAFFGNAKNGSSVDCSKVFGLTHTVVAGDLTAVAMHELLKGPTPYEKSKGYSSALPEGVDQPKFTTGEGNGIAVDFDETLQQGVAGSCRVSAIRSQIEQTVLTAVVQEGIQRVRIYVNGNFEDILQP